MSQLKNKQFLYPLSGSFTGSFSGSFTGQSTSASYALTASYISGSINVSTFPYSGSAIITGSLQVIGNIIGYNSSSYLGNLAGINTDQSSYSVYLGEQAGYNAASSSYATLIGPFAGLNASKSLAITAVGYQAGISMSNANNSTAIGAFSGYAASNAFGSSFLGLYAGAAAISSSYSTFIGPYAGYQLVSSSYTVALGYNAGFNSTLGNNNILIGTNITLPSGSSNSINIGGLIFGSGSYYNTGSVSSGSVNGFIGINQPNPQYSLDVSGSGRFSNTVYLPQSTSTLAFANASSPSLGLKMYANSLMIFVTPGGDTFKIGTNYVATNAPITFGSQGAAPYIGYNGNNLLINAGTLTTTGYTSIQTGNFLVGSIADNGIDKLQINGSASITGSLNVSGSINVSGSVINNLTASYAISASFVPASGVIGLNLSQITTGSVTASVNIGTGSFIITSGSSTLLNIDNAGNITGSGNIALTAGNKIISIASPISSGNGGDISIYSGNATTSGTGGNIYIYPGNGAGAQGAGKIYLGNSNGWDGVNVTGILTVGSTGPNTGDVLRVNAGGRNALTIYWDNLTPFMQYGLVSGRQSRFTNSTSYTFDNTLIIGSNIDAGYKLLVSGSGVSGSFNANNTLYVSGSNVGINTTVSSAYNLDVNGTARTSGQHTVGTLGFTNAISTVSSVGNAYINFYTRGFRGFDLYNGSSAAEAQKVLIGDFTTYGVESSRYASAMLIVESVTKGFLPPRMTLAQRTAISTPAVGLLVYETGSAPTEGIWTYESTGWQQVLTNTGSLSISGSVTATSFTGSLSGSATTAVSASFAATASSADNFTVRGTLTAQTIVAQIVSSSTVYSSGSNRFGNDLANTQVFTGSVSMTGSLVVNNISGSNAPLGFLDIPGATSNARGLILGRGTGANAAVGISLFASDQQNLNATATNGGLVTITAGTFQASTEVLVNTIRPTTPGGTISILDRYVGAATIRLLGNSQNIQMGTTGSDNGYRLSVFASGPSNISSGSIFASGSVLISGATTITGSLTVVTGSGVEFQVTDTGVKIGNATTDINTVTGSLNISGSITTTGTITAQTLVVQTVSSSVLYSSGSNRFGNDITNTQTFTGSILATGSNHTIYGNVGINRLPITNLHVYNPSGSTQIDEIVRIENQGTFSGSLRFQVGSVSARGGDIRYYEGNTLYSATHHDVNRLDYITYGAYPINFNPNQTTRFTVQPNGNAGVGNWTSPAVPLSYFHIAYSPSASSAVGTVSIGGGFFNGQAGSGSFTGSNAGTSIAINELATFGGRFIDAQITGSPVFQINAAAGGYQPTSTPVLYVNNITTTNPANVATFKNSGANGTRITIASSDRSFQLSTNGNADGGSVVGNWNITSGTPTLRLMNANETITALSISSNPTTGTSTFTTSGSAGQIIFQNNGLITTGSLNVSGSLNVNGTITATTLVVQTVSSSVLYSSGSNRFGNDISNTQIFTGSVNMTGSLTLTGSLNVSGSITGSLFGSASYAISASYAPSSGGTSIIIVGTGTNSTLRCGVSNTSCGAYSFAGGGQSNNATGNCSVVAGGRLGTASGGYSSVVGGAGNTASGVQSFAGGGINNTASGYRSVSIGGIFNVSCANSTFVGGGGCNVASVCYAGTVSGYGNKACNVASFIGSGFYNTASGTYAIIGGGYCNTSSGSISFIGGGCNNSVLGTSGSAIVAGFNNLICLNTTASFIGGGLSNINSGSFATIGGGKSNLAKSDCSTVAGGFSNIACGLNAPFVGGGDSNNAAGQFSSIVGGRSNSNSGRYGAIAGGSFNTVSCSGGAVVGGKCNTSSGNYSTVSGGYKNCITNYFSSIGAGANNFITTCYAFIGAGTNNLVSGHCSSVVGGQQNTGSGDFGFIGGGLSQLSSGAYSFIGGGQLNVACSSYSFIGGGITNKSCGYASFVGSGKCITASGTYSTVSGGYKNIASGDNSFIGAGTTNTASGVKSAIGGGQKNLAQAFNSFIGGGDCNSVCNTTSGCLAYGAVVAGGVGNNTCGGTFTLASCAFTVAPTICNAGSMSFVGGGFQNRATGACSTIGGGQFNTASGSYSFIGGGCNNIVLGTSGSAIVAGSFNTICSTASGSFIGGGNNNIASGSFSAVLGGQSNTGSAAFAGVFGCNVNNNVACSFAANRLIASNLATAGCAVCADANGMLVPYTAGGGSIIVAGGGTCSTLRCGVSNTASSCYSTALGGRCNTASGCYSFVGGGYQVCATGTYATVGGGYYSVASGPCSTVAGGAGTAVGDFSAVGGGFCNVAFGCGSFVGGGFFALACGIYSGVVGCCITNPIACSFASNQLWACNLVGTTVAVCVGTNGLLVRGASDSRLKNCVETIGYGLSEIKQLNPVSFYWNEQERDRRGCEKQIGFIAQEVEPIIPELVGQSAEGEYSFSPDKLVSVLTKAVQELSKKVEDQEIKITQLQEILTRNNIV